MRTNHADFATWAFSPDGRHIILSGRVTTQIDLATGQTFQRRFQFPDSWATLDADDNILTHGPNAWKYLHALHTAPDGHVEVVNPWSAPPA